MNTDRAELERAVIQAANAWERSRERGRHEYGTRDAAQALIEAVDALRAASLPWELQQRPWSQISAGWEVQHPKQPDTWLRVLATKLVLGRQRVRLEFPDGQLATFPYPPDAVVTCRPGEPSEVGTALEVLGDGAYILEDEL